MSPGASAAASSHGPEQHFFEHLVDTGAGKLRCLVGGAGAPLVVLQGLEAFSADDALERLTANHRVHYFALPDAGAGASATPRELAATFAEGMTSLGIEQAAILAGSFSARIALWLAIDHPARVSKLVLESPLLSGELQEGTPGALAAAQLFSRPERVPASAEASLAAARPRLSSWLAATGTEALSAELGKVSAPTLVALGASDRLLPSDLAATLSRALPDSAVVFVYDAGHSPRQERPAAFVELAADFIARGQSFIINRAGSLLNP